MIHWPGVFRTWLVRWLWLWLGIWVLSKKIPNVPTSLFLSSRAMVLRLEPSIVAFSSLCSNSNCSGNTFIHYRIWALKDDSRSIAWVLSFPFISVPPV